MGCIPSEAKKKIEIYPPDFTLTTKKLKRQEEIDYFEYVICGKQVKFTSLKLENSKLRQSRLEVCKSSLFLCTQDNDN